MFKLVPDRDRGFRVFQPVSLFCASGMGEYENALRYQTTVEKEKGRQTLRVSSIKRRYGKSG